MQQKGLVGTVANYSMQIYKLQPIVATKMWGPVLQNLQGFFFSFFFQEKLGIQSFMCYLLICKCWQQIQV